jgi:hypothetical protein
MADSYLDSQATYVDRDAMAGLRRVVSTLADTLTLTNGDSNSVVFATKSSATQTFTLPSAVTAGLQYTFVCNNAAGEILINPATGEKIRGQTLATLGVDADTQAISNTTTGIKNTAATNVVGDSITLLSDGVDTWHIVGSTGIWSTQ